MGNRRRTVESYIGQDLALQAVARTGGSGGAVVRTELDLPLSLLQSFTGSISSSIVFPNVLGTGIGGWDVEDAYLVGADILVREQFAAPGLSAATARIVVDTPDLLGLTGTANVFNGGTGYLAPLPTLLQLLIGSPILPQVTISITGATLDQLTAGSLLCTLLYSVLPSP